MEVRTGKTLTALLAAHYVEASRVLFVTKLKAIKSIENDYQLFRFGYTLKVTNYEQLHHCNGTYDVVIIDEAHSVGAFPKPSQRAENLQLIILKSRAKVILLSGTPNPESYSQLYHQFWVTGVGPWIAKWPTFYKWAKDYVYVRERMFNGIRIRDYSKAYDGKVKKDIEPYMITFSQEAAGFSQEIIEEVKTVRMKPETYTMAGTILADRYINHPSGEIVADTAVKEMSKLHQMYSGTVKFEDGKSTIIDTTKAEFIRDQYRGQKIAIYYMFIAEGQLLRTVFPNCTSSPEEFNRNDNLVFISQIQSGSMGVNLSTADVIVMYNISFSSLLYWQARARMQSKDRVKASQVHWIFAEDGIEQKVYDAVVKKKDYTTIYFRKDYENARSAIAG